MQALEKLGSWIAHHPEMILLFAALLTIASVHYSQQIEMNVGTTAFVQESSKLYQEYSHLYVDRFGIDSIAVVIEADDVASPQMLKAMHQVCKHMSEVNHVLGLVSISEIVAEAEEKTTGKSKIPDSQEEIDAILASVDPNELQVIMPDRKHTVLDVAVPLHLPDSQIEEIVTETEATVENSIFPPDTTISVTGNIPLNISIKSEMSANMTELLIVAIVLMAIALIIFFRQSKYPILPLPVVLLGIAWTFGAMGYLKIPLSFVSMAAFPILIGLGIDYAIQFRTRIDEERSLGRAADEAAASMTAHTVPAVFIALILTAAGFVSLMTSTVPMVRDFGKLCTLGIFMCFLSAALVGTTVLCHIPMKGPGQEKGSGNSKSVQSGDEARKKTDTAGAVGPVLARTARESVARWKAVLAVTVIVAIIGIELDESIPTITDYKKYIPQDLPELVNYRHLTKFYGGTDDMEVIIQGDDLTNPEILKWMDGFSSYEVSERNEVLSSTSIATYIKAANGGQMPDDRTAIQSIIDQLPSTTTEQYLDGHDTALIKLKLGNAQDNIGEEGIMKLKDEIDKDIVWLELPPGYSAAQTGKDYLLSSVIVGLTTGRVKMTMLGLFLIYLLLLIIYRDPIKSVLPIVPMVIVIGWMGLAMHYLDISYTPMTATLGALVLGVGSEYAVLIMERFYEELGKGGEMMEVLKKTFYRIGSAIASSGLTVVFGFSALVFSPFMITNNFGAVTVLSMIVALLMTFTVFPVLLIELEGRRKRFKAAAVDLRCRARALVSW
jgi:hydrophobe/amphiphile efflux-3 (HAE3) family protein